MLVKVPSGGKGKGKKVDNRFISDNARKRYKGAAQRKDKGFIPERGLTTNHADEWSKGRLSGLFMSQLKHAAVEPIVREFYANLLECNEGVVYVRGIDVPFDVTEINKFF